MMSSINLVSIAGRSPRSLPMHRILQGMCRRIMILRGLRV